MNPSYLFFNFDLEEQSYTLDSKDTYKIFLESGVLKNEVILSPLSFLWLELIKEFE